LWWIHQDLAGQKVIYASGAGGQRIYVVPGLDLVIVHVVDNYQNLNVPDGKLQVLVKRIIESKIGEAQTTATLVPYQAKPIAEYQNLIQVNKSDVRPYLGDYENPFLGKVTVRWQNDHMVLDTRSGTFNLFAHDRNTFWLEDIHYPIIFKKGNEENHRVAEAQLNDHHIATEVICYY